MYIENKEKEANEMRQSSIALIILGFAGIVFLALEFFNVTKILPEAMKSPLTMITMAILLLVFFVSGIMSIASSKRMRAKGSKETELRKDIWEWFTSEYDGEKLDSILISYGDSEEDMFFMRTGAIQQLIMEKYNVSDIDFLQNLSEALYDEIYE